jgi:hypothetical protein
VEEPRAARLDASVGAQAPKTRCSACC